MGTYRSTYPMMSEANQGTSVPHFAWFHPGNYMSGTRSGINPFQGSQHNPEGITAVPIRSIPINEVTNTVNNEAEPDKPTKKPKTSTKNSTDGAAKEPKVKQPKKGSAKSPKAKGKGKSPAKREKKNLNFSTYEPSMDASGPPAPFCSCTGSPRQCYRWGSGGWQSACCTINISEYPLPMSATRPGSRTAGRKMSHGAYDKLLQRLSFEGYDLAQAIDLKDHWARHGTNKFVTIK